ncbi:hypothetical protein BJX65DRAFT_301234 [Aspergillus insuetus]
MWWQETAPGRYERPLDTAELLYLGVAALGEELRMQHWLTSSTIELKSAPSVEDVRRAWIALRHRHPHIASVLLDGVEKRFQYTVPSDEELERWVRETLVVYPDGDTHNAAYLEGTLPPTDTMILHYLPYTRQLLFRTPHWRTDGRGMFLLQHAFCTLLVSEADAPVFDGSEAINLPPSFSQLEGLTDEPATPEMSQASDAILGVVFTGSPPSSLRESLPNTTPGSSHRITIRLDQGTSKEIIAASKARGQTVTTTVHTALVTVMRRHTDTPDGRMLGFNPFDQRKRLTAPWNGIGSHGAACIYHTGKPCSIEFKEHADYDAVAEYLSAYYRQDLQPVYSHMLDYHKKLGRILSAPIEVLNESPGAARPEFSSLGIVDNFLQQSYTGRMGTFEVVDWSLAVAAVIRPLQIHLWTWNGRMHLSCNYNEAFYTAEFVEEFVEEWKDVLVQELLHRKSA